MKMTQQTLAKLSPRKEHADFVCALTIRQTGTVIKPRPRDVASEKWMGMCEVSHTFRHCILIHQDSGVTWKKQKEAVWPSHNEAYNGI